MSAGAAASPSGANADPAATPPIPAATLILVRDAPAGGPPGVDALMLRRNARLEFAGGMWVFPGGRVDPGDVAGDGGELGAARRAAVREAVEEAGLQVEASTLVAFSHWTPPPVLIKRFATWFFLAPAPRGTVAIDGGEIHDHAWMAPQEALGRRDLGEIELAPPTWITLHRLAGYASVAEALADSAGREPERFETRFAPTAEGPVALYAGDAAYEGGDPGAPGPRHRLWMLESGWRYERSVPDA